ncbi:STE20-related kinase adapter protein alpha [Ischnura elegans]|uniref:STE20-related kinase adapter protein alpha n=1 Tax=Ischnura elegans TaxID=197161 RepID=UPI001ED8980D|nr:STE20-related kinase adapter protein alpha [Ischnura elegans]XP_046399700.1 STE20-related kinase adapter protein alpha [Ischnura elegans]XP_046399702.1 STE20-related kinase adapter protein alpha [Ischnura elegans]XP_046399703.1 STE20-related kinase adapter protein alpha [Ischnura elegans]
MAQGLTPVHPPIFCASQPSALCSSNPEDFECYPGTTLGICCGSIGTVRLGRHRSTGTPIAIRCIDMDKAKGEEPSLIQHEIILTRQLRHPNLLPYYSSFVNKSEVWVVMPFMSLGSCRDLLKCGQYPIGLPEVAIAYILQDVLNALQYIHSKGYIHRSVKASHILISGCGRVCLSGLRYACQIIRDCRWQRSVHNFPQSTSANLNWLSPEVLEQNLLGYNEKSDIYSVGITACELANGIVPFANIPNTLMLTEKLRGITPQLIDRSTYSSSLPLHQNCDEAQENDSDRVHHTDSGVGESVTSNNHHQQHTGAGFKIGDGLDEGRAVGNHSATSFRIGGPQGGGLMCDEAIDRDDDEGIWTQRQFTDAFHQLVELCLVRDPVRRPSAEPLLCHQFFKQYRRRRRSGGNVGSVDVDGQPSPLLEILKPASQLVCNQWQRQQNSPDELQSLLAAEMFEDMYIGHESWEF